MSNRLLAAVVAAAILVFCYVAHADSGQSSTPDFKTVYGPPGPFRKMAAHYQQTGYLQMLARAGNQGLDLPTPITLSMASCGQANAFYQPRWHRIVMCYELVHAIAEDNAHQVRRTREIIRRTQQQMLVVWFHELGHALIDILDLPVIGQEEDAADQLAVLLLVGMHDIRANRAIVTAASAQYRSGRRSVLSNSRFADEHSLGQQRYYNMMCLLYGSDSERQRELVTRGFITPRQARRCPAQYDKAARSWKQLLGAHLASARIMIH